ncbi:MAG: peptide deformylase [Clostridiales bacterium]|nr:MAG: peptide deformylase [Clostridiales bacterium]
MAIRQITKEGDPALRKKVPPRDGIQRERLGVLIDDMWDTMYKADGVGLAAPPVSVLGRIAVVDVEDGNKYELVNPVIVESEGSQVGQEGCLSIPGYNCNVKRPYRVKVTAFDRFGNEQTYDVQGFPAVSFWHEIDHLDGILFKDKKTDEPADR